MQWCDVSMHPCDVSRQSCDVIRQSCDASMQNSDDGARETLKSRLAYCVNHVGVEYSQVSQK